MIGNPTNFQHTSHIGSGDMGSAFTVGIGGTPLCAVGRTLIARPAHHGPAPPSIRPVSCCWQLKDVQTQMNSKGTGAGAVTADVSPAARAIPLDEAARRQSGAVCRRPTCCAACLRACCACTQHAHKKCMQNQIGMHTAGNVVCVFSLCACAHAG